MSIVERIEEDLERLKKTRDKGIVNPETGSSVKIDGDGNVTIAPNQTLQYKMKYDQSSATEISIESTTITNRKNVIADDIIINNHKLNPQLYELTDYKYIDNEKTNVIGNITMFGTILVKAWEPTLKRYVLIRRLIRTPIFSNELNLPNAPELMNIQKDITEDLEKIKNAFSTKNE